MVKKRRKNDSAWSVYGSIIQTRMDDMGITQKGLTERLSQIGHEIVPTTISKIARGDSEPTAENFMAINYALFGDIAPRIVTGPMSVMLNMRR